MSEFGANGLPRGSITIISDDYSLANKGAQSHAETADLSDKQATARDFADSLAHKAGELGREGDVNFFKLNLDDRKEGKIQTPVPGADPASGAAGGAGA